jgi:hypothetical protein
VMHQAFSRSSEAVLLQLEGQRFVRITEFGKSGAVMMSRSSSESIWSKRSSAFCRTFRLCLITDLLVHFTSDIATAAFGLHACGHHPHEDRRSLDFAPSRRPPTLSRKSPSLQ